MIKLIPVDATAPTILKTAANDSTNTVISTYVTYSTKVYT